MKQILFILILITISILGVASKPIKNKGYLINFAANEWFFQPCEDSTINIFESLNKASFSLYNTPQGYIDFEKKVNKSIDSFRIVYPVFYSKKYVTELKYHYCELIYENTFRIRAGNVIPCIYIIERNEKKYNLGCFLFDIKIIDLILL